MQVPDGLKEYFPILLRKLGFITLGWIVLFFLSHPFRTTSGTINILVLFSPMVGALGGVVAGWYLVDKASEDSTLSGPTLWIPLIALLWAVFWIIEGVMRPIFHWEFGFGGWMEVTTAMILGAVTIVWYGSAQE